MRSSALHAFRPLHTRRAFDGFHSYAAAQAKRNSLQATHAWRPQFQTTTSSWRIADRARLSSRAFRSVDAQPVHVQSVRFKRLPFFTRKRFVKTIYWFAAIYVLLKVLLPPDLVIEVEFEDADKAKDKKKDKKPGTGIEVTDEDEEDDDEEAEFGEGDLFIPFTRAVQLPKTYYKGSDPEWQEFIKIANDEERRNALSASLKDQVAKTVASEPPLAKLLGANIRGGQHWIDFHFPDGPPPSLEREGLMIGSGRIAWVSEIVDETTHSKQTRLTWPKDAAIAAYQTSKTMGEMAYRSFMLSFGFAKREWPVATKEGLRWARIDTLIEVVANGFDSPRINPGLIVKRDELKQLAPPTEDKSTLPWPLSLLPKFKSRPHEVYHSTSLWAKAIRSAYVAKSLLVFRFKTAQGNKVIKPPRGAVIMLGLIEVRGSKGRCLFDAKASYDPKTDQILQVNARLKSHKYWAQRPKGGQ